MVNSRVKCEGNRVASLYSDGLRIGSGGADIASEIIRIQVYDITVSRLLYERS